MIVIEDMLDGRNSMIQLPFVEVAFSPMLGEFTQLLFGAVQSAAVAAVYLPHCIAMVEVRVNPVNQRGNGIGLVGSARLAVLGLSQSSKSRQRGRQEHTVQESSHEETASCPMELLPAGMCR